MLIARKHPLDCAITLLCLVLILALGNKVAEQGMKSRVKSESQGNSEYPLRKQSGLEGLILQSSVTLKTTVVSPSIPRRGGKAVRMEYVRSKHLRIA